MSLGDPFGSRPSRLTLEPRPGESDRPLWSVMIPTYHCARYLRETLASVLAQDPGPDVMQIEVVDDHSTDDDPAAVVRELGRGRVGFYRQPENVGHIRNFETCLVRSRGRLVHLLHGDDLVLDGFYREMESAFTASPGIGAVFCRHILADERGHWTRISWLEQLADGVLEHWLERILVEQRIQAPAVVVRREVYEHLGGFDRRLTCRGEDWEMWIRIAAHYPVWYITRPLALYRTHRTSLSGRAARLGADTRDLRMTLEIVDSYIREYLPRDRARALMRQARATVALAAVRSAHRLLDGGDTSGAGAQIREALACQPSARVVRAALPVLARVVFSTGRRELSRSYSPRRWIDRPANSALQRRRGRSMP